MDTGGQRRGTGLFNGVAGRHRRQQVVGKCVSSDMLSDTPVNNCCLCGFYQENDLRICWHLYYNVQRQGTLIYM